MAVVPFQMRLHQAKDRKRTGERADCHCLGLLGLARRREGEGVVYGRRCARSERVSAEGERQTAL